jgi:hypothetical protein
MRASKPPARFGSCLALVAAALTGPFAPTGFGGDNVWTGSGPLGGPPVTGVAVDPLVPSTVFAATGGGIFKSTDGGASWDRLDGSGSPDCAEGVTIHPTAPTTLYAARCSGPPGVGKSNDGGSTWQAADSGLGSSLVISLAVDPLEPSTVYAGTTIGVFRSTDGGSSWRAVTSGMGVQTVYALATDPVTRSTVYAGAHFGGVFKSTNRGDRWAEASTGLPTFPNPFVPSILLPPTIEALAIDPATPATVYAGASFPAGVFRSTTGGGAWTEVSPPGGYPIHALVLDPSAPAIVYAGSAISFLPGVWRSPDGGASWSPFGNGLSDPAVTALGIDRTGTFLYAGTLSGEVFAYRIATPRLHITLPSGRVPPRVVSPRP